MANDKKWLGEVLKHFNLPITLSSQRQLMKHDNLVLYFYHCRYVSIAYVTLAMFCRLAPITFSIFVGLYNYFITTNTRISHAYIMPKFQPSITSKQIAGAYVKNCNFNPLTIGTYYNCFFIFVSTLNISFWRNVTSSNKISQNRWPPLILSNLNNYQSLQVGENPDEIIWWLKG